MPFFTRKSQWTAASEGQWKGPASTGVSLVHVLDELELSNQANIDGQGCFHWPCCSWNKSMPSSLFIRRTSVRGGCRVECPLATVKTYQWSTVSYRPRDAILELWRLQKLRLVLLESWGSFRLRENKTHKNVDPTFPLNSNTSLCPQRSVAPTSHQRSFFMRTETITKSHNET